jgi:hypothetical protein
VVLLSEKQTDILGTVEGQGGFILCEEYHKGIVLHNTVLYEEYHKGSVLHNTIYFLHELYHLSLIYNDNHNIDALRMLVLKPL